MISSISVSHSLESGLDTMVLVYSLLQGHPAATACEQLLRAHAGWFTSPLVLFEAKAILTKVYGEDPAITTLKLSQVVGGPLVLLELDPSEVTIVLRLTDTYALDLTDAVLLHPACKNRVPFMATEDHNLSLVCAQLGITPVSPLDNAVRQAVGAWEAAHVPPKGLPRVLRRVHQWLSESHPQASQAFWSQTGAGSHLP
jgi:predicted nucleic acid-binding protein